MEERLGEMRKGRRERMRKGAIVSSSPQGMTSWSSSIKISFFQAYRMHYWQASEAARHSQVCSIENRGYIYSTCKFI